MVNNPPESANQVKITVITVFVDGPIAPNHNIKKEEKRRKKKDSVGQRQERDLESLMKLRFREEKVHVKAKRPF